MPDGAEFQRSFAHAVSARRPPKGMPPAFAVYRNTWLKGLLDALDASFPTVAMILGPETFKAVAIEFARDHRPDTPVLALYGGEFPDFLAVHRAALDIPYLRDVAALDRLWTECFLAPDAPALRPQDYGSLRPAEMFGLRPRLHPAARIGWFETPAVTIWQAHRAEGEFEEIEPEWRAERALVSRRGAAVTVTLLDEAAYTILIEIRNGRTLGSAIATAAEAHPGSDLAGGVSTIIASGALTGAGKEQE